MPVNWTDYWNTGDNNDVNPAFDKAEILSIIRSVSPSILRVQPPEVREAVQAVIDDSSDVTIVKGLHHVGSEKIDIKMRRGYTVHLYCMNYRLVDSGLRQPFDDVVRAGSGWRITGSSARRGDGNEGYQGMDKRGEIDAERGDGATKREAHVAFRTKYYHSGAVIEKSP
ncbi:hypothetical protein R3X27_07025 [Tropicimonas sp. TH_r6]|uniref:hypothetical protein n=1 Tax=Tropicimonas sp. TH_r6 TaxID=3082085 RepID=UPI002952C39C|nr:hypothetical protein [Tropicimonas sp. TH_r6]MDV7142432.1 hypothetical protein [Tropicimonas sp. TH_r6]